VRANTTAGFSIVSYTKSANDADTYGHGLNQAPDLMIVKSRANTDNWLVYHKNLGATGGVVLELTSAFSTNAGYWNNTAPTSNVFTTGSFNLDGSAIAYCFHSVDGFSKFGSYTGNGSADGPFVYTGFRPAFVMFKRTDVSGNSWIMLDAYRNAYNPVDKFVSANLDAAENTPYPVDFTANGFKIRATTTNLNGSGGTYIFMAFAENPFQLSRAR